jgi:hypothetical protein
VLISKTGGRDKSKQIFVEQGGRLRERTGLSF